MDGSEDRGRPDALGLPEQRYRMGMVAVNLGLAANLLLAVVKTSVGILAHSKALLADGVNSCSDVAYYLVVRVFMALARKRPDREHPYGHSQLESIAAVVVGAFVITTAVALFWDAVNSAFDLVVGTDEPRKPGRIALWVALATIAIKAVLFVVTRTIGRRTRSPAVVALACDHRNDVFASAGAAVGILLGGAGYPVADPLAGAMVSLVVLWTGIQILRDSSANLMDTVPGDDLERQVKDTLRAVSGVQDVEEVQAHHFGPYLVMNVTIGMQGSLSVAEGHRIASDVEQALMRNVSFLRRVYVHYHPARGQG